jgi:glutamyl-tRNA reductase
VSAAANRLSVVGVSHHAVPVELRERVALDAAAAVTLTRELGDAVGLSTCDRTEVYLADGSEERTVALLEERAGVPLARLVYRLRDGDAAAHLFRVASGLDSLVPGEGEILRQVRAAFDAATPGPLLDRVFRQALRTGKRVRTETRIGRSPASVPSAAAVLAQQLLDGLEGRRAMIIGAGRMCALAAANLAARGATIAYVADRTAARARELADRFGGLPLTLEQFPAKLGDVDVVLTATSAPGLVVRAADVPDRRRPLLCLIDIAVPRDVDPAIGALAGCGVYNIDDLETVVSETLSVRWTEAARAERIVGEETRRFCDWQAALEVVPAIVAVRARAEEIRAAELAKLGRLSERERRAIEVATAQILNKLLHAPTVRLKEAAATAEGYAYADALYHLFAPG